MNPHNRYLVIFGLVGMLMFSSCGPEVLYQEKQRIDGTEWRYEQALEYQFEVDDTTSQYNMILDINYNRSFSYENIYLNIGTEFPVSPTAKQEFSVNLLDKNGIWKGTCKGNDCLREILMKELFSFPETGNYTIKISQWSRNEALTGINSIQLSIIKEE